MPNQHKPLREFCVLPLTAFFTSNSSIAPDAEIREPIEFYYHLNLDDTEIAKQMKDHYDTQKYGLRCVSEAFLL